jgi:hypothetical protein
MNPPVPNDDSQRELERHALRNVRGLVDKMESIEETDRHTQRRLLIWVMVGVLAVACLVGYVLWRSHADAGKPVVIDLKKLPPIRPGPQ